MKPTNQQPKVKVTRTAGVVKWRDFADDPDPIGRELDTRPVFAEAEDDITGRELVPLSQVMPPGKTKADMCPNCFQIPATSGVCGC